MHTGAWTRLWLGCLMGPASSAVVPSAPELGLLLARQVDSKTPRKKGLKLADRPDEASHRRASVGAARTLAQMHGVGSDPTTEEAGPRAPPPCLCTEDRRQR